MKVVTASQMREIDRVTINERGIPGKVLMYQAGYSVSRYILENIPNPDNLAVLAGSGNNGGDGFVAAYLLNNAGIDIKIYTTGKPGSFTSDTEVYYNLCNNSGLEINHISNTPETINLNKISLVIDSLTGTGFNGLPRENLNRIIEIINSTSVPVVSIDMPSGLPSDGDAPEGNAVKADYTITIGLPKISLVTYPGKEYAGLVEIADIGFPYDLADSESLTRELIDKQFAKRFFTLPDHSDIHKGDKGHLLLVGGFDNLEGAIMMTAAAALETGIGLISLLTTARARKIIAGKIPELMTISFDEAGEKDALCELLNKRKYNAMVIGPGMGRTDNALNYFTNIMNLLPETGINKVLIDGDGLSHLALYLENNILHRSIDFIITPHFGEASRLMKTGIDTIKSNRVKAAEKLAEKTGATVVLKGPASIVSGKTGTFINTTGNPSLATGGTGDILSGITGALMLREDIIPASCLGTYIHGSAADLYCSENNTDLLKATDLINYIRHAIGSI